jgi:hypothetical protein
MDTRHMFNSTGNLRPPTYLELALEENGAVLGVLKEQGKCQRGMTMIEKLEVFLGSLLFGLLVFAGLGLSQSYHLSQQDSEQMESSLEASKGK